MEKRKTCELMGNAKDRARWRSTIVSVIQRGALKIIIITITCITFIPTDAGCLEYGKLYDKEECLTNLRVQFADLPKYISFVR